jgi:hypothetical protein
MVTKKNTTLFVPLWHITKQCFVLGFKAGVEETPFYLGQRNVKLGKFRIRATYMEIDCGSGMLKLSGSNFASSTSYGFRHFEVYSHRYEYRRR